MRYWFMTHYPPVPGQRDILNVYLQDKHRDAAKDMAPGDRIFIYEFLGGQDLVREGKIIRRETGHGAIVCEAAIGTKLCPRDPDDAIEIYTNGKKANWAWIAATTNRTMGNLGRKQINAIFGYGPGNYFFGFNRGRGIKELDADVYQELLSAFSDSKSPRP